MTRSRVEANKGESGSDVLEELEEATTHQAMCAMCEELGVVCEEQTERGASARDS